MVSVAPSGAQGEVASVESHYARVPEATPGMVVGLNLTGLSAHAVARGSILCPCDAAVAPVRCLTAKLVVLVDDKVGLRPGADVLLGCQTARVAARLQVLTSTLNRKTGEVLEAFPASLKAGDQAMVTLVPQGVLALETYASCASLGRIALFGQGTMLAVGVVETVEREGKGGPLKGLRKK